MYCGLLTWDGSALYIWYTPLTNACSAVKYFMIISHFPAGVCKIQTFLPEHGRLVTCKPWRYEKARASVGGQFLSGSSFWRTLRSTSQVFLLYILGTRVILMVQYSSFWFYAMIVTFNLSSLFIKINLILMSKDISKVSHRLSELTSNVSVIYTMP